MIRDASLYKYTIILLYDRPVCLSQGRGILYSVIRSFMKALGFNMYTVHLDTLRTIRNLQWIADLYSRYPCITNEMRTTYKFCAFDLVFPI